MPRLDWPKHVIAELPELDELFAPLLQHEAVGLAVSGGADSLALMLLAARWAMERPAPALFVYTVDHGLRAEARTEAAMVVSIAEALGLPARSLLWAGEKPTTGLQEAARETRYRLIGEAMAIDGATALVTAHHREDQAETLLMRLAHGSGLDGLRGMEIASTVEGTAVLRPLLGVSRALLRAVVEAAELDPAEDPSNEDPAYERVRWRKLLPELSALGLDPDTLAVFARRIGEANLALGELANAAFDESVMIDGFGAARFLQADFAALSPAVATRVLKRVLNVVGGRQKPRALGQIERLRDSLAGPAEIGSTTALGCIIRCDGDTVIVAREPGRLSIPRFSLQPESEVIWDDRFIIANGSSDAVMSVGVIPHIDRRKLADFLGFRVTTPAEAIRTAPVVRDADDRILALGGWSFDERVAVRLMVD